MSSTSASGVQVREIHVCYFAALRERRGAAEDTLKSDAATPRDLYDRLREQYGFALGAGQVRVAINDAFASWDQGLKAGDRVAFIPPVAGG